MQNKKNCDKIIVICKKHHFIYYTHFFAFVKRGTKKMSPKNKIFNIILKIICAAFLVLALFLSVTAIVYAAGGGTPNIFGTNVYLIKSDLVFDNGSDIFDDLKTGTALMGKQVPFGSIDPGNIVIFRLENGKPALAKVEHCDLLDGVYSFDAVTETGTPITLSQSQIVAKGMSYSYFWGALISFAISPVGMMIIAIAPSLIIVVLEIFKYAAKIMPAPEIETVKKQYEVPTYVPDANIPTRERRGTAEAAKAYRTASLDSSIGIYDTRSSDVATGRKTAPDSRNEYAELASARNHQQQNPLFTSPTRSQRPVQQATRRTIPLSQKKLNEAIEETKAAHELDDMKKMRAQVVRDIQKTRGAAIAAEKEFETSERLIQKEARKTSNLSKTAVFGELSRQMTADITEAAARASAQQQSRTQTQPQVQTQTQSTQRPQLLKPGSGQQNRRPRPTAAEPEDNVRQYTPRRGTNTTTSIPRLDALLRDDSDSQYNIDDILAGLDRKRT